MSVDAAMRTWERLDDDSGWVNHAEHYVISDVAMNELGSELPEHAIRLPHVMDLAWAWYRRRFEA